MKLKNIDFMNSNYLANITKLLYECKDYLKWYHEGNIKYKPSASDIRAEYNHRCEDNAIYKEYHYPKVTTKIVKKLLGEQR